MAKGLKNGDKVRINRCSCYHGADANFNPTYVTTGVVVNVSEAGFNHHVKWPSGLINYYNDRDLVKVEV